MIGGGFTTAVASRNLHFLGRRSTGGAWRTGAIGSRQINSNAQTKRILGVALLELWTLIYADHRHF